MTDTTPTVRIITEPEVVADKVAALLVPFIKDAVDAAVAKALANHKVLPIAGSREADAVLEPAKALRADLDGTRLRFGLLLRHLLTALVPLLLAAVTLGAVWWYVTIHSQQGDAPPPPAAEQTQQAAPAQAGGLAEPPSTELQPPPSAELPSPKAQRWAASGPSGSLGAAASRVTVRSWAVAVNDAVGRSSTTGPGATVRPLAV